MLLLEEQKCRMYFYYVAMKHDNDEDLDFKNVKS